MDSECISLDDTEVVPPDAFRKRMPGGPISARAVNGFGMYFVGRHGGRPSRCISETDAWRARLRAGRKWIRNAFRWTTRRSSLQMHFGNGFLEGPPPCGP